MPRNPITGKKTKLDPAGILKDSESRKNAKQDFTDARIFKMWSKQIPYFPEEEYDQLSRLYRNRGRIYTRMAEDEESRRMRSPKLQSYKRGGLVKRSGLAKVHKGEFVMPAKSAKQYGAMAAAMHGKGAMGIPEGVAKEFVKKTPEKKRSSFAKALAKRRKK